MNVEKIDNIRILAPELRNVTTGYQNVIRITSPEEKEKRNNQNKAGREKYEMKSFSVDELSSYFDSPAKCKDEAENIENTAEYLYKVLELTTELIDKYLSKSDLQNQLDAFVLNQKDWMQYDQILESILLKDAYFLRTLYSKYESIYKLKIKLLKSDNIYSYKVFFDSNFDFTLNLSNQDKLFYSLFIRLSDIKERLTSSFSSTALSDDFYSCLKPLYTDFEKIGKRNREIELNEILSRLDFSTTLDESCRDVIIVLKEELSDYITSKSFLNNPVGKALFAIDEDKYNSLDFFYSGIDKDSIKDDFTLSSEEFQIKRKSVLKEIQEDLVALQKYARDEKGKINSITFISIVPEDNNRLLDAIQWLSKNINKKIPMVKSIFPNFCRMNSNPYFRTAMDWLIYTVKEKKFNSFTYKEYAEFYCQVLLNSKEIKLPENSKEKEAAKGAQEFIHLVHYILNNLNGKEIEKTVFSRDFHNYLNTKNNKVSEPMNPYFQENFFEKIKS